MSKARELIISPKVSKKQLGKFLPQLENEGIGIVYCDPKLIGKTKLTTIFTSTLAKYVVLEKNSSAKPKGQKVGRKFKVF